MALWPLHSSAQFVRDRTGFADELLAIRHLKLFEAVSIEIMSQKLTTICQLYNSSNTYLPVINHDERQLRVKIA
jgi:hypothetical protein